MNQIPISSPNDYFQMTTTIDQNIWLFIFKWNETYGLFFVDIYLNNEIYLYGLGVLGGVFWLEDYSLGYNFVSIGTTSTPDDLGTNMLLYQITEQEAIAAGYLKE